MTLKGLLDGLHDAAKSDNYNQKLACRCTDPTCFRQHPGMPIMTGPAPDEYQAHEWGTSFK
ncbi:uncharacterized protein CLUP02_13897 [Colletotrichum lupini]|uniref:Uncharacterized protein n=1 Tax=Colletotrichum lupini TaxID=145971 RepID=A0A9Q8WM29_9PEZI|nr:uncharacterized protein CLUP02_13897 [Colletotrichum lupini]UQC88374.1 hypothetical protein CLUP02_13897 [Colletotrichum lupini]